MRKYPKIFPEILCQQIDHYYQAHKGQDEKINLMQKLINDLNMQTEVFPVLLKIENTNLPETAAYTNLAPLSLFLHYCIEIFGYANQIKPINKKEYIACLKKIKKSALDLANTIKNLQGKGIYIPEWINASSSLICEASSNLLLYPKFLEKNLPSIIDVMITLAKSARAFLQHPPFYKHGNMGISRNIKNFKHDYFITRLALYTQDLFKKPLYGVIATATNVVFDTDQFNGENIRMRLIDFKKRRIR